MFQALRERVQNKDDRGFTLIELMVVVLIIAILIAIAIPTFLGARTKAQDRAAQSDLRTALVTAQAYYTDNETYLDTDNAGTAAAYQVDEPSIIFSADADTAPLGSTVGVYDASDTQVVLVKQSKSGEYFCVAQTTSTATAFGRDTTLANIDDVAGCTGGW